MEPNDMLYADPLDILFENRNKSYGAYPLRKFYAQRLYVSMGITLSVVIIISALYLGFRSGQRVALVYITGDNFLTPVDLTPPPKPIAVPVKSVAPHPPVTTIAYTPPLIVRVNQPIQATPMVEDLNEASISTKTLAGGQDNGEIPNNGNAQSVGTATIGEHVEDKPVILDRSEIMPEFPGGIEALKRYLSRNLHMPDSNPEPGSIVKVIARFVVGADGKVSNIEIIQAADNIFNDEVKRVILKMPDWKPGSQNHRNVAVYFSLPVNFVSAE